jgi:hypothetical protein
MVSSTTTIAAATTVTDPCSSLRFDRRHCGRREMQGEGQIRPGGDNRDDEATVPAQLNAGAGRSDATGGSDRGALITPRRQPGGLARRVDAADLHRYGGDAGQTQHENDDQGCDAEGRFDGGRSGIVG